MTLPAVIKIDDDRSDIPPVIKVDEIIYKVQRS
jgi:hypothetical protein